MRNNYFLPQRANHRHHYWRFGFCPSVMLMVRFLWTSFSDLVTLHFSLNKLSPNRRNVNFRWCPIFLNGVLSYCFLSFSRQFLMFNYKLLDQRVAGIGFSKFNQIQPTVATTAFHVRSGKRKSKGPNPQQMHYLGNMVWYPMIHFKLHRNLWSWMAFSHRGVDPCLRFVYSLD